MVCAEAWVSFLFLKMIGRVRHNQKHRERSIKVMESSPGVLNNLDIFVHHGSLTYFLMKYFLLRDIYKEITIKGLITREIDPCV